MKTLASERDKAEVLRRVESLRHDSVRHWGRMSAHQMVCHLTDGCRLLIGQRTSPLATRPIPGYLIKWIALYVPVRWPPGISTTPEFDQEIAGTAPVSFDVDAAELRRLLGEIVPERYGRLEGRMHPIFGPMSASAWLRWGYLHADHHLRQFGA